MTTLTDLQRAGLTPPIAPVQATITQAGRPLTDPIEVAAALAILEFPLRAELDSPFDGAWLIDLPNDVDAVGLDYLVRGPSTHGEYRIEVEFP